jgi:hypothetical protein
VVPVEEPRLRNQRGFDLPAMKHTHHATLRDDVAIAPRRLDIDAIYDMPTDMSSMLSLI